MNGDSVVGADWLVPLYVDDIDYDAEVYINDNGACVVTLDDGSVFSFGFQPLRFYKKIGRALHKTVDEVRCLIYQEVVSYWGFEQDIIVEHLADMIMDNWGVRYDN